MTGPKSDISGKCLCLNPSYTLNFSPNRLHWWQWQSMHVCIFSGMFSSKALPKMAELIISWLLHKNSQDRQKPCCAVQYMPQHNTSSMWWQLTRLERAILTLVCAETAFSASPLVTQEPASPWAGLTSSVLRPSLGAAEALLFLLCLFLHLFLCFWEVLPRTPQFI